MNINEYLGHPPQHHPHQQQPHTQSDFRQHLPIQQISEHDYVTRSDMAQVIVTIIQHYERRIQQLEQGYEVIIQQLKINQDQINHNTQANSRDITSPTILTDHSQQNSLQQTAPTSHNQQENTHSNNIHINLTHNQITTNNTNTGNVLQPNSSLINQSNTQPQQRNQESASTKPSEILSTENSESSLSQPIVTAAAGHQTNKQLKSYSQNKPRQIESSCNQIIDEINSIISTSKPSTTKAQQQPIKFQNKIVNNNNNISLDNTLHGQSCIIYNDSISIPTSTKYKQGSVAALQSLVNTNANDKNLKIHNFSEIKNKISMFNIQQFQSPSMTSNLNKIQQSPDQENTNDKSQANGQYQSSPDSLMAVTETQTQKDLVQVESNYKQSKQMISICTQDYNITELQSPAQDLPQKQNIVQQNKKKHSKSLNHGQQLQKPEKNKTQNETMGCQNISLSILMEEDSNSQQVLETKTKNTHSTSNLRDQRSTNGVLQILNHNVSSNHAVKKPILDKQRSTASLGNKIQATLNQTILQQTHKQSKSSSQNNKKAKVQVQSKAHCMIQKHQKSVNKTQNLQQSKLQTKVDLQKQLEHLQSQSNVSIQQDKNMRNLNSSADSKENKAIKAHKKQIQSMVKKQIISRTLATVGSTSQCQTAKQSETSSSSIAKILMPQFTNEKLLKIRTPLSQSRTKNSAYNPSMDGSKSLCSDLQLSTKKEQQYRSEQSNLDTILIELPVEKNVLSQNRTFDSSNNITKEELLTMRDLETIQQNQQTKVDEIDNQIDLAISREELKVKEGPITIQSKKISSQNSILGQSAFNLNADCEQSIIHSGSMTTREKSGPIQVGYLDKHTILVKKRAPASRLQGTQAESRLSNLVQTIQKYKNEQSSNEPRSLSREESMANMYFKLDNCKEEEQLDLLDRKLQQLSLDSQQLRKSKILPGSSSNHTSISSIHSEKQRSKKDEDQCDNSVVIDNVELSSSVIKINNGNQVQQSNEDNSLLVIQNESMHSQNYKRDSQSSTQKSRNLQQYQEYFSFSNVEKENLMKTTQENGNSQTSVSICKDSKKFDTQEYCKLERSDTMIKLTVQSEQQSQQQLIEEEEQDEIIAFKTCFKDLTGDVLDIISEFLPNHDQVIPPIFTLTNSTILANYCNYKKENFAIQNEILVDQIAELKKELFDYFDQKLFKMSKGLSIIYFSNINSKEWVILEEMCKERALSKDDLTLLRVYMLLLGIKPKQTNPELQEQLNKLINEHKNRLNQIFNPELHFTFGPQILCQVGSLLQNFSLEHYIINYQKTQQTQIKKIRTLQILAQIIYEALQFCKIVPNRIESDIRELERVIDIYTNQQERLDRMIKVKDEE